MQNLQFSDSGPVERVVFDLVDLVVVQGPGGEKKGDQFIKESRERCGDLLRMAETTYTCSACTLITLDGSLVILFPSRSLEREKLSLHKFVQSKS